MAFGSIGQYKDRLDYMDDVEMSDITLLPSRQHRMIHGLYFKSWMGLEIGIPPNGGGGGKGYGSNIRIDRCRVENVIKPVYLESE